MPLPNWTVSLVAQARQVIHEFCAIENLLPLLSVETCGDVMLRMVDGEELVFSCVPVIIVRQYFPRERKLGRVPRGTVTGVDKIVGTHRRPI